MRSRNIRWPLVALGAMLAALAQAACAASVTAAGRVAAPGCPPHGPSIPAQSSAAVGAQGAGRSAPALVPPGAVVVSICQYARPLPSSKVRLTPARRIVLRGIVAAGLAAIVSGGPPATGHARRCDRSGGRLPFSQALVFGYRTGRPVRAVVSYTDCSLAIVTAAGRTSMLADPLQSDLFYLTSVTRRPHGPRTPDLTGLRIRAAAATVSPDHWSLYVDGEAIDRAVQPGAVIFQTLPAGTPDAGPGKDIDVVLAVRPTPACTTGQLALSYFSGGAGTGNDFGSVLVRDDSPRPCRLTGPLRLVGTGRSGQPVTQAITFPVAGVAVLSPATGPVSQRITTAGSPQAAARGAFVGTLALEAEYRDGPASVDHGYCEPLWIIPAAWRVTMGHGQALTVANADRYNSRGVGGSSGGLVTCRGELGGIRPATVNWRPGATGS